MSEVASSFQVSSEEIEAYDRDGAICLRGVIPADEVELLREVSLKFMREGKGRKRGGAADAAQGPKFFSAVYVGDVEPRFREFAMNSNLPVAASKIMRTNKVRFFYDQLFIKEPGTNSVSHWHNDLPYWPLLGNDIASFWVALTPVNAASSGVQYIAGSHHWQHMYQAITTDDDPAYKDPALSPAPNYFDPEVRGDLRVLSWDMQPGDVLVHHPLTVHGASGNESTDQMRVGLSIRYLGEDARWDPRAYVMKLPVEPAVPPGSYPADDHAFPLLQLDH